MYKESNNTKKYEFNVTWRVNSEPYFNTTTHTERIDMNIDANVTFIGVPQYVWFAYSQGSSTNSYAS